MKKRLIFAAVIFVLLCTGASAYSESQGVELRDVPELPSDIGLRPGEITFGYRGKLGAFVLPPSKVGTYYDDSVNYSPPGTPPVVGQVGIEVEGGISEHEKAGNSIKILYEKIEQEKTFCGTYIIIKGDLSKYKTVTFMIKGEKGGETFEVGLNDIISHRREDAVIAGTIYRYLPSGVTTEWQEVKVPLADFFGTDLTKIYSIVFHFNEGGQGVFWIDNLRFHEELLVDRESQTREKGYLLLDNFDHATSVNLLGCKTNSYKRLPSVCRHYWDKGVYCGDKGRSLKLVYNKEPSGWCGYYTLLNQIDGPYYNLTDYDKVSFMVKGEKGGETFELGMADKNWLTIGDSLKAGGVEKYLPGGVTTEWKEIVIPLNDFGLLDFSEMGSFVINFNVKGSGVVYIDDIKFHLTKPEKKEGGSK